MMTCISDYLEGLKTENLEKLLAFKAFLEVWLRLAGRLTGRPGGVLDQVSPKLAQFGATLAQMGTKLGPSWRQDGPQSSKLGPSWSQAGPS